MMFVLKTTKSFGLFREVSDQITERFRFFFSLVTVTLPQPDKLLMRSGGGGSTGSTADDAGLLL